MVPLGILWVDGAFYFTAGAATRRARNLARNAQSVLSFATGQFDLVIEGKAVKVTDPVKAI